jgi:hypothetical protein
MTKWWELNQVNGLEAMPQVPYGSYSPERAAWYMQAAFSASPNIQHIPPGPGLGNGTGIAHAYLSYAWYALQLILNDGNGTQEGHAPIDYPYVTAYLESSEENIYSYLYWSWKGLQTNTLHATITRSDPSVGINNGWAYSYMNPYILVDRSWSPSIHGSMPLAQVASLAQQYLQAWFNQASSYSPSQYYAGGWTSSREMPGTGAPLAFFSSAVWDMLPPYRFMGVDPNLTYAISAWAATMWPSGNWAANNAIVCTNFFTCR